VSVSSCSEDGRPFQVSVATNLVVVILYSQAPFTRRILLSNRLYSRLSNRLYRVNGISLFMMVIIVCLLSCSCCLLSPRAGSDEYWAHSFVDFGAIYRLLVYIVCFPTYPFFFTFPYLSFPLRIDPLHFQAGGRKTVRGNQNRLFLVVLVYFMLYCFWSFSCCPSNMECWKWATWKWWTQETVGLEIVGLENDGQTFGIWKMTDWKMTVLRTKKWSLQLCVLHKAPTQNCFETIYSM